jgi:hypothetical protein
MTNIIRTGELHDEVVTTTAFGNDQQIRQSLAYIQGNILLVAQLLKENRDNKYYKQLDYQTWYSYLGSLGLAESTVRGWIRVYEVFVQRYKFDAKRLLVAGVSKLTTILPVIEQDPDGWLAIAETNSKSDVINLVREKQGKEPMNQIQREQEGSHVDGVMSGEDFLEYVRDCPCCVCGELEAEAHHYPQTRNRTGNDYYVIPLCRKCHTLYHSRPMLYDWDWKNKIIEFYLKIIIKEV